ncbi:MAG: DNA/RNA nuclease SfsA, partial [Hyphomicrobium sp.]
KHLRELAAMAGEGHRAVMLFLIQRTDAKYFSIAADLDPGYAEAFRVATNAGVETLAFCCRMSEEEIALDRAVPIVR